MSTLSAVEIILRPIVALVLFGGAALLARPLVRRAQRMKPGWLKRFLLQPVNVVPRNEAERQSWWPTFWWLAPMALLGWLILRSQA